MAKEDDVVGPRSAVVFVDKLAEGAFASQFGEELQALNALLRDESSAREVTVKGEIVVKLKFACDRSGFVNIDYDIKVKQPPKVSHRGLMWVNKDGNLTTENPKQANLPGLREVLTPRRAPREVPPAIAAAGAPAGEGE